MKTIPETDQIKATVERMEKQFSAQEGEEERRACGGLIYSLPSALKLISRMSATYG